MSDTHRTPDDRLARFLDGLMAPEERAAFERELDASETLRAEVDLQRRIDATLRAAFDAPSEPARDPDLPVEAPGGRRIGPWGRFGAVAAIVVLAVVLAIVLEPLLRSAYQPSRKPLYGEGARLVEPRGFYEALVDDGFGVDYVCETEQQYIAKTSEALGTPLVLGQLPGVEVLGWRTAPRTKVLRGRQMTLLSRVDGREVVVAIGDARLNSSVPWEEPSMPIFQREIDGLVLVEITPLGSSRVIDGFRAAE